MPTSTQVYKKGTTCAMVGLHLGDTFRHSNVSISMGLKSFCPWCLKLGRNTKTIAIHLWVVHYRTAIVWDVCWVFTSMSAQSILDHHSGCKAKHNKNMWRVKNPQKPPPIRILGDKRKCPSHTVQMLPSSHNGGNVAPHLPSSPASECTSIHSLDCS